MKYLIWGLVFIAGIVGLTIYFRQNKKDKPISLKAKKNNNTNRPTFKKAVSQIKRSSLPEREKLGAAALALELRKRQIQALENTGK